MKIKSSILTFVFCCIFLICNSQIALSADKNGTKKEITKSAERKDELPRVTLSENIKPKWKAVQFAVYNKYKNSTEMYFVNIGDTIIIPYYSHKIFVKDVIYNSNQANNDSVDIVVYRDDREIFSGLIYQSYPIINPFEKGGHGELELKFIARHPSIYVPLSLNKFQNDKDGKLYLLYRNPKSDALYYKYNDSGDAWDRIAENIKSFAIEPSNKEIFYAITKYNAVQKSMDAGKKWITIQNGLPPNTADVFLNIVINPHNTQEVFVLTTVGLFKTNDAGFSWERMSLIEPQVMQLLIHPKDKSVYYARTFNGLFISKDAGSSWNKMDDTLPKKLVKLKGRTAEKFPVVTKAIAIVNFDNPSLLALTDENGILKSEDNGLTWKEFNNGFNKDDGAYSIYTDGSDIYIGSYGCIYHLKNGSESWNKIDLPKEGTQTVVGINGIYPLEDDKGFIITDTAGKIIFVDKDLNLIGLNYGVMPHSIITNLKSANINGTNYIYAFTNNNNYIDINKVGLSYSSDNGKTWQRILLETDSDSPRIFVSPFNNKEMWFFENRDWGTNFVTFNSGFTWNKVKELERWRISCFVFHPTDPNIRYICGGNLYRYDIKSGNMVDLKVKAGGFIFDQNDPNKMLADLQLSSDGGWTWENISSNLKNIDNKDFSEGFFIEPIYFNSNDMVLFVRSGFYKWENTGYLLSSEDLGKSWKILQSKANPGFIYMSPFDPNNIFIGYKDNDQGVIRVSQSLDRGRTWKPFCIYKPKDYSYSWLKNINMVITKNGDKKIYIGTSDGLYSTSNNGLTWELLGGIKEKIENTANLRIVPPDISPNMVKLDETTIMNNLIEKVDATPFFGLGGKEVNRTAKIQIAIIISEDGNVISAKVNPSKDIWTAYIRANSDRETIYQSAKDAVMKYKFKPFKRNDVIVKVEGVVTIPVKFTLTRRAE